MNIPALWREPAGQRGIFSTFTLHIFAMLFMLLDHMWATVIPYNQWLTCVGRLAYPIFAFLLTEGFFHTSDRKKYKRRLLVMALVSEIPFNLMMGGTVLYPFHQNVMWSLLLSLVLMELAEKVKAKEWSGFLRWPLIALIFALGSLIGLITFLDYYHYGVLMVLVFWLFRGRSPLKRLGQLLGMIFVNVLIFSGMYFELSLFGLSFEIPEQGLACFSLLFIWLYNGKPGPKGKWVKVLNYGFYPLHILILSALALWVL